MPIDVITAETPAHYSAFARLVADYVDWSRTRYADDRGFVEGTFGHQALASELQALPSSYGLPNGRAFLAMADDEAVGCVAYRRLSETICEMKRLFVAGAGQGRGVGRRLCQASIASAQRDGFALMRLDSADRFAEALALYRSVGFRSCQPYHDYPPAIMPSIVFMELPLTATAGERA